ncbi:MAG: hypothetical protein QF652_04750, partial [Dehalococcoidia bacterium]|nr:hypothetical protein [Dehalococcoidia bacterium]
MSLSGILDAVRRQASYRRLVETVRSGGPNPVVLDPLDGAKPYLVAALWRDLGRPLLWLLPGPDDARAAFDHVAPYLPTPGDAETGRSFVFLFPEPDSLPYERLASDATTSRDRLGALAALAESKGGAMTSPLAKEVHGRPTAGGRPLVELQGSIRPDFAPLIIASGHAAIQTTLPPEVMQEAAYTLRLGDSFVIEDAARRWVDLGYEAVPAVEFPGSFSRRGGIIDVWSPGSDSPARIELFGPEIESLRLFDPATQRSFDNVESISITAARELLPSLMPSGPTSIDRSTMDAGDPGGFLQDLARLAEGALFPGSEFFSPMFQSTTLLDHLPAETVVVIDRPARLHVALTELAARGDEIRSGQVERGALPGNFPSPLASIDGFERSLGDVPRRVHLDPFSAGAGLAEDDAVPRFGSLGFDAPDSYGGQIPRLAQDIRRAR